MWPKPCCVCGVTKIALNVDERSGVLRTTVVPANRSDEPRFGLLDGTVIVFFLLCVAGLIYMMTL
jgi:hypothetical protein